jgi:hypothetical protein
MRRLAGPAALLAILVACASVTPEPDGALLRATELPLAPDAPAGTRLGPLVFRGALDLRSADRRFGGLSGLRVDPGGHVVAVSDEGYFVEFDLVEDGEGRLRGVRDGRIEPMLGVDGRPIEAKRDHDAEDLEILPDGTRLVVFERNVRLDYFPPGAATPERSVSLRSLVAPTNQAIEALARLAGGELLMIAEHQGAERGVRDGWLGEPGAWRPFAYVPPGGQDVAAAAPLPDGDLLVLQRSFSLFGGFRCRLVRVAGAAVRPGARVEGGEVLRLESPGLADDFEGLAVRAGGGAASVYLVSDDNYSPFQRTLLLKFDFTG